MRRLAIICLLACLALPLYFGLKRLPFVFGLESFDTYMAKHYGFEGWPMHQYIYSHIPKGTGILYVGSSNPPQFYWQDYIVSWGSLSGPYHYILFVKQDMKQNRDGTWTNTYLPNLHLTFSAIEGKIWETDRAILYRATKSG